MMSQVCKDTKIKSKLTQLSGEELQGRTSNNSNEARVDIRTRGFWKWGQQAFFDLRVFYPNACRYRNKSLQQCYIMNDQKKKLVYNERILQIDHGTYTLLMFSTNGSMRIKGVWHKWCLKREIFHSQFQVTGFEQMFALFKEVESNILKNSKIWNWSWCIWHCRQNINWWQQR